MSRDSDLQKAIEAIESGNKQKALQILTQIVKQNPQHEMAWLRLASIIKNFDKQYKCLEQVLKINPDNDIARKRITQLDSIRVKSVTKAVVSSSDTKPFTPIQPKKDVETKKCPYCAETIKVEAKLCRFCRRDLRTGLQSQPTITNQPQMPIVIQSPPQRLWSPGVAAVLSLIIPGAGQIYKGKVGSGILWLIFVVIGYSVLIVPGLILHLTCILNAVSGNPYPEGNVSRGGITQNPNSSWPGPLILAGVLIGGFVLCIAVVLLNTVILRPESTVTSNIIPTEQKATTTLIPTATPIIVSGPFYSIEKLITGVSGNYLADWDMIGYDRDGYITDTDTASSYSIDIAIVNPHNISRQRLLKILYNNLRAFYYDFPAKSITSVDIVLRPGNMDSGCAFGVGIGRKVISRYLPREMPKDIETWYQALVVARDFGFDDDMVTAFGNDPIDSQLCGQYPNWKR